MSSHVGVTRTCPQAGCWSGVSFEFQWPRSGSTSQATVCHRARAPPSLTLNSACEPRAHLPHKKAASRNPVSCQWAHLANDYPNSAVTCVLSPILTHGGAAIHQRGQARLRAAHTFTFLQGITLRQQRPRGLPPGVRSGLPLATGLHEAGYGP